ncbi:unnamed protein product [Candidula unifasciata]|uniref:peptidylprolyl isomerase n=1 Tax=Candidula unifasciata TaxID=100452 RepID=A0A8S3YJB8_9EUPU|nr:unnamed protein product [Candidula unifasciata]
MEEHPTPAPEYCADLNQNSATLHGGKVEIVGPNENGALSNGVHAEDSENRLSLSELDQQKQIPDSSADMTTSTSQDTGFGSACVSEVSSPVETIEGIGGRVENLPAETEGEINDGDVLGDATDNDENTLNSEASFENIVETAHTKDVNNDVEVCGEEIDKIEEPVGLEVENTNVIIEHSNNEEEDIAEKASDEAENNRDKPVSNIVNEDAVKDVADHNEETEHKLVDSLNVGSTDCKESENENVDITASDEVIDRIIDDATNTHLEAEEYKEIVVNNVEQSEVNYKNTDGVVEVVSENGKYQTSEIEKKDDNSTLKEPEAEKASSSDTENENIEKVTADITSSIESKTEEYEVKSEETAVEQEQQHTVADVSGEVEQAAGGEDQTVNDVLSEAVDNKADDANAVNDEDTGVMDILGNGLLKKKVLVPGKGEHTRPNNGDIVTVRVDGLLPDGTHVDTGEITFALNDGDVILAFDLAVALMEEGEKCELFTSERYAYGSLGRDPDIPKDTSITYTLELVKVESPPAITEMNYDQRLKLGEAKRERGNYLFGRTDYSGAINSYTRAVKLLDNPELNEGIDESCRSVLTESWVKCYNNLAACQLKIDAVDSAIKSCEKVLSVQKDNVKALFRLGKAYGIKGEVDVAISYLRRAIKLEPESKIMQQEMLNLTRRKSKETATEKELYQRMFGVRPGDKSLADENRKANSNKLVKWTLVAGGLAAVLISVGLTWYRAS